MNKRLTIYEIKKRTAKTNPYFFSRKTMEFFGQTLKDFRIHKQADGRYRIEAPTYRGPDKLNRPTVRYFNPSTNGLDLEEYEDLRETL
jgi:hypothetical protein